MWLYHYLIHYSPYGALFVGNLVSVDCLVLHFDAAFLLFRTFVRSWSMLDYGSCYFIWLGAFWVLVIDRKGKFCGGCTILATFWFIWLEGNGLVFEDKWQKCFFLGIILSSWLCFGYSLLKNLTVFRTSNKSVFTWVLF